MEIYCVKERKRTPSVPGSERYERARNGRLMLKAKCASCGITKHFLRKKELNYILLRIKKSQVLLRGGIGQ